MFKARGGPNRLLKGAGTRRQRAKRFIGRVAVGAVLAGSGLTALALSPQLASASPATSAPFTECPHVGADTSCAILIVINPVGAPSIMTDGSQGPYDGVEDTMVGIYNNSAQTITSLPLTGNDIFGFDQDGICDPNNSNVSFSPGADCSANTDPGQGSGYGGPDSTFNVTDSSDGSVVFENGGLAPQGTTFFSLEGVLDSTSFTINITTPTGVAVSATEGTDFNKTVATFTDSNTSDSASAFSATIDWGDGTSTSAGTITGSAGSFTVKGKHTYADEGSYTVTTTISGPNPTVTATSTATVAEADTLAGIAGSVSATSGTSFSGPVATFSDTGYPTNSAGDFTSTINFGDGTPTVAGTVSGPSAGVFTVSGTHTYTGIGFFPVTVTLTEDSPGTATATVTSTDLTTCGSGGTTITGFYNSAVVARGQTCIINANVHGAVSAQPGSSVLVLNSEINGAFAANGAQTIQVCGNTFGNGSLTLTGTTGPVYIGSNAPGFPGDACQPNGINGTLTITDSTGAIEVGNNSINGITTLKNNTPPTAPEVTGNFIASNLNCSGNSPAPTNDGSANSFSHHGQGTGQCTGL